MKRDADKSARNRIIAKLDAAIKALAPTVLADTNAVSLHSMNALIGAKHDRIFDLKNQVINSPDEFKNKWYQGLLGVIEKYPTSSSYNWVHNNLKEHESFRKYCSLFLERSYLKRYDELSKNRPSPTQSEIWIGQTNANYGLLVTPRFKNNAWENDKSEIRAFKEGYWTIGHVMHTGLVLPDKNKTFKFTDIEQYLLFLTDTLVRNSGSKYEYEIACLYSDFVKTSSKPKSVPLLIPEFRYLGLERKHKYRLDFMIINPYTLQRVGFELSPWSSHGYLSKTKQHTQQEINKMASDNFEAEMKKHRGYFKEHSVVTLIFTDNQLNDCGKLFREEFKPLLDPEVPATQLSFEVMEVFD